MNDMLKLLSADQIVLHLCKPVVVEFHDNTLIQIFVVNSRRADGDLMC